MLPQIHHFCVASQSALTATEAMNSVCDLQSIFRIGTQTFVSAYVAVYKCIRFTARTITIRFQAIDEFTSVHIV